VIRHFFDDRLHNHRRALRQARCHARIQPLNQSFFFSPSDGSDSGAISAIAVSSLISESIARARLASTALSRVTSKLIFSAKPSFTPPSPWRKAPRSRVTCSVDIGTPPSTSVVPPLARETSNAVRTYARASDNNR